jgi:hypothetical protein
LLHVFTITQVPCLCGNHREEKVFIYTASVVDIITIY